MTNQMHQEKQDFYSVGAIIKEFLEHVTISIITIGALANAQHTHNNTPPLRLSNAPYFCGWCGADLTPKGFVADEWYRETFAEKDE